jgi:hypothetical protein
MTDAKKCFIAIFIFGIIAGIMSRGSSATPFQQLFIYASFAVLVGGGAVLKFGFGWGLLTSAVFSFSVLLAGANVAASATAMVAVLIFSFGVNYIIGKIFSRILP